MNTRTDLNRTLLARDAFGRELIIEEYVIYKEVLSENQPVWEKLDRLHFQNGHLLKYYEEDQIFRKYGTNIVLELVS